MFVKNLNLGADLNLGDFMVQFRFSNFHTGIADADQGRCQALADSVNQP